MILEHVIAPAGKLLFTFILILCALLSCDSRYEFLSKYVALVCKKTRAICQGVFQLSIGDTVYGVTGYLGDFLNVKVS